MNNKKMKSSKKSHTLISIAGFFISMFIMIMVLIAIDSFGGGVQGMSSQSSPKDVVEKFCKLDAAGARLSSDTRKDIETLLAWGEEGGYDEMIVIKDFKVNKAVIGKSTSKVSVDYFVLGSTDSFIFHKAKNRRSSVNFKLLKQEGKWKIEGPVIAPHVYWENAISHLRLLQKSEPARKKQLESIIRAIEEEASH